MTSDLGNLVRLIPLKLNEVPLHADIERHLAFSPHNKHPPSSSSSSDDSPAGPSSTTLDQDGRPLLAPFLTALLTEATTFVDSTLPFVFHRKSTKTNPPAIASIQVLQCMISAEEISKIPWKEANIPRKSSRLRQTYGEAWFARQSTHQNKAATGTASWTEFDEGLRKEHSEHERQYTPDVFDSYKVLDWDRQIQGLGGAVEGFEEISMQVYEMCHKLPFPLAPRVFSVLVVHAKTGADGLIVVQVPINLKGIKQSFYSSGRNQKEGDTPIKRKKPVFGVYTSIERCKTTSSGDIEWTMATASDAKGNLPMAAQKLGVPGAIVNDVGLFMKWTADNRSST